MTGVESWPRMKKQLESPRKGAWRMSRRQRKLRAQQSEALAIRRDKERLLFIELLLYALSICCGDIGCVLRSGMGVAGVWVKVALRTESKEPTGNLL